MELDITKWADQDIIDEYINNNKFFSRKICHINTNSKNKYSGTVKLAACATVAIDSNLSLSF